MLGGAISKLSLTRMRFSCAMLHKVKSCNGTGVTRRLVLPPVCKSNARRWSILGYYHRLSLGNLRHVSETHRMDCAANALMSLSEL